MILLLAANLVGLGPSVVRGTLDSIGPAGPATPAEPGEGLLFVVPADDGHGVFVLAGAGTDEQGAVLLVPGATQVEVPSLGSRTLAEALAVAGPSAPALAIENALGLRVGAVAVLDAAALAGVLGRGAPVPIRLREPVEVGGTTWQGERELRAADAHALLTAPTDDGFARLLAAHAVLEGWLGSLDGDDEVETAASKVATVAEGSDRVVRDVLGRLAGGDARFDTLTVETVAAAPGEQRFTLASTAADEAADWLPGLRQASGPRPRVEILNGTGAPGLAFRVAERIVPEGFQIVLTGNAKNFDHEETVIVVHDRSRKESAERLAEVMGVGVLRAPRQAVSVVDISILVGQDFSPGGA